MTTSYLNQLKSFFSKELHRGSLLYIFVIFISLIGLINAFRFGAASLDYYFVRNSIELWQDQGLVQDKQQYDSAKRAISTANTLHSSNPLFVELRAQISEWGALSEFEPSGSLSTAKANYLLATEIRPLWPVTWTNLALLKWRLQEFDDEMLLYLEKADALGRQKSEVHLLYTKLGLALYKSNHPMYTKLKDTVHERIRKGLRSHIIRYEIRAYINQNGYLKVACRWMKPLDDMVFSEILECK